jgi:tRNA G10  N-methylase Trm11
MTIIKSISKSQDQILQDIVSLHTGPIECDVTYGSGCFYKKLPRPALCFDLEPRKGQFHVRQADVCHLPLENGSVRSIIFDPPFMARTGPGAVLKARFGELVGTIKDLWNFYFRAMKEIHRVLVPGGWLIFKNQDGVLSGVNNFTHCEIYYMAKSLGFVPKDLFVLVASTPRMMQPKHKVQKHARKYHSYFWVFQKRSL